MDEPAAIATAAKTKDCFQIEQAKLEAEKLLAMSERWSSIALVCVKVDLNLPVRVDLSRDINTMLLEGLTLTTCRS